MDFLKDRNRWTYSLAGLFVLALAGTALYVQSLSRNLEANTSIILYGALTVVGLTGGLAIWFTYHARKEVMIVRDNTTDDNESRSPRLTISNTMVNTNGTIVATGKKPVNLNGLSSEVVTIYAEDKSIRYISPAVEAVFGYKQLDMIGQSDIDNIHPDHRASFSHIFTRLRENPTEQIKVEYAYKTKAGGYIWLESAGTNGLS
ncbi:MAG TPA: PAS domain-containing protein, partial [Chryseosolibacter sp.]|nr:PAS domain-containing protein [Chryseosolibacter sp.]